MSHDFTSFFLSWLSNPLRVGAVAPSSNALADIMTSAITPASGPVIELGPGTGVFTQKLLQKGLRQEDLILIEYGSDFVRTLQLRFPGAQVIWMDATRLAAMPIAAHHSIGTVVSGLPLLTMSPRKVISILVGAFRYLRADGAFYQFTYGPRVPIPRPILDRLSLKATVVGHTFSNLPPATVYRLTRRAPSRLIFPPQQNPARVQAQM